MLGTRASLENAALVYRISSGELLYQLSPSDIQSGEEYGTSVSIQWPHLAVSAPLTQSILPGRGSVYLFNLREELCLADLTGDSILNFFDVSTFLVGYKDHNPIADLNNDNSIDFFDVAEFLGSYNNGCP